MPNWPGDNAVFPVAEPLIKGFEAFKANPYLDSAGVPTIGWGTIAYPDGTRVTMFDPAITGDYGEECLVFEMTQKCAGVSSYLARVPTINQAAAMVSLTYNIGVPAFSTSTVVNEFNAGNTNSAADAFLLWDKAHV